MLLGVAQLGGRTDACDDFAAPSHRYFGQVLHCRFGRLSAEQLDRLGEQFSRDRVDAGTRAVEDVAQQLNSRIRSHLVVAQQDGKPRLGVENAGEPEQLVFHLVDLTGLLGADQQGLPC